jgi:hypothetical protein
MWRFVLGDDRLSLLHNQSTADFKQLKAGQGCDTVNDAPSSCYSWRVVRCVGVLKAVDGLSLLLVLTATARFTAAAAVICMLSCLRLEPRHSLRLRQQLDAASFASTALHLLNPHAAIQPTASSAVNGAFLQQHVAALNAPSQVLVNVQAYCLDLATALVLDKSVMLLVSPKCTTCLSPSVCS